ncbi:MAG: ABC transporter substrate-binding protein [Candidatus Aphodomonas sp.]|nr:ABC transporter substrate-binding protein [Candidatus Aphodomonas sp.]
MKRILALILAFVMILAMGSLASAEEHKPVTINLYCDSATNGANEARKAAFEAQYPWITVELVEMPAGSSERIRTLSTVLQAKDDSMDAFLIDCTWPEMFAGAGWLEPLEDVYTAEELQQFTEGALEGCRVNGTLYCLPVFLNTGAMLYRADLLEKYGFQPATTWDELIEQSKVVMAGEKGVAGYAAAWQQAEALTCCAMEHIWGFGGSVLDENGNPSFNTAEVKAGVSSMKKILDEGVAIDGILGMMSKDVKAAFFAGQVLYIRDWSAALAAANDPEQSSVAGKVKVAQLPAGPLDATQYNCNGGWNIGVSAYSSHKEEAKLLVRYWTSEEAMMYGATMSGKMPARPAMYSEDAFVEAMPDMAELLEFAKSCRNRPGSAYYEEVSAALQQAVTSVLMGTADIDSAFDALQAEEMKIYER